MAQMSPTLAETLDPGPAAELVRILELRAVWEETMETPAGKPVGYTTQNLFRRQQTFEAYRARLAAYQSAYRTQRVPEPTLSSGDRLKAWCVTVRTLLQRAGSAECPPTLVARTYRAADQIAGRTNRPAVAHQSPGTAAEAVRCLDGIIAWCDEKGA